MGRKSLPDNHKRKQRTLYLTDEEHASLEALLDRMRTGKSQPAITTPRETVTTTAPRSLPTQTPVSPPLPLIRKNNPLEGEVTPTFKEKDAKRTKKTIAQPASVEDAEGEWSARCSYLPVVERAEA